MSSRPDHNPSDDNLNDQHFSDDELLRYSRQLLLEPFGFEAQRRFKQASVLIVGLGGLGSPAALYLAAAGIGRLMLADGDQLELTNLQRQILYRTAQVGEDKAYAAASALAALNPEISLQAVNHFMDPATLEPLVAEADVVLDCSDNLEARYAINQACVSHQTAHVVGAAMGLEGQFIFFDHAKADSPCYQCMVPAIDHRPAANCHNSGVLGPLLGMIGSLQAVATLNHLAGLATTENTLLRFAATDLNWQSISLIQDPQCPICTNRG